MKKLFFTLMLWGGVIALSACSKDDSVPPKAFPDAKFRTALAKLGFVVTDDGLDTTNATNKKLFATTQQLDVSELGIASLKGIEYFTALTELDCSGNRIITLNLSKNIRLAILDCVNNQMSKLNLPKSTVLTELYCHWNLLTVLDVSKNTALTELYCIGNLLTVLDLSKNTALTELYCNWNQLTALDVSKNTALTKLYCHWNLLTALDISMLSKLSEDEMKLGDQGKAELLTLTLTLTLTAAQDASWINQDNGGNSRITKNVIP